MSVTMIEGASRPAQFIDPVTGAPATMRTYQGEAVGSLFTTWRDPRKSEHRLVILLPTGTGKTVILSNVVREQIAERPTSRVVILVHRDELVRQTVAQVQRWNPGVSVGVEKAAERAAATDQVIVASVQTLGRSAARRAALGKVDLIIIDECHHAVAETYIRVITDLGGFATSDPTRVMGVTATLERNDKLGLGDVWQAVTYTRDIDWAISSGFLVKPTVVPVRLDLDVAGVGRHGGDYSARGLADRLKDARAPQALAHAYRQHAMRRDGSLRQGVVFVTTVQAGGEMLAAFAAEGITGALISDATSVADRREVFERMRAGAITVLINVMVLTEGFDMPQIEVVVIARPTQSHGLWAQMVGRGMRPHIFASGERKSVCLVLDIVGASFVHDLSTRAVLSTTAPGEREKMNGAGSGKPGERSGPVITYKVHVRKGARKHAKVERIETRGETRKVVTVTTIYGHPVPELIRRAQQAIRVDQLGRAGLR